MRALIIFVLVWTLSLAAQAGEACFERPKETGFVLVTIAYPKEANRIFVAGYFDNGHETEYPVFAKREDAEVEAKRLGFCVLDYGVQLGDNDGHYTNWKKVEGYSIWRRKAD